jgi:hypothetical protein
MVGVQDERVWLSYSGQRLNQFGIAPQTIVDRVHDRNINMPGGTVELPDQRIVVRPTGEYTDASEIGGTVLAVSHEGYPLYLNDLVEVTRGYVDPPDVLNYRTIKVAPDGAPWVEAHADRKGPRADLRLQTGRPVTISVPTRVKGTHRRVRPRPHTAAMKRLRLRLAARTAGRPDEATSRRKSATRSHRSTATCWRRLVSSSWSRFDLHGVADALLSGDLHSDHRRDDARPVAALRDRPPAGLHRRGSSSRFGACSWTPRLWPRTPSTARLANGQPRGHGRVAWAQATVTPVFYATLTNVVAFLPLLLVRGQDRRLHLLAPDRLSFSLLASMLVAWTFARSWASTCSRAEGL